MVDHLVVLIDEDARLLPHVVDEEFDHVEEVDDRVDFRRRGKQKVPQVVSCDGPLVLAVEQARRAGCGVLSLTFLNVFALFLGCWLERDGRVASERSRS